MINTLDINNYKKCREKQYKSYICLPECGSYVINKLKKTKEWNKLNKKDFLSKKDMDTIAEKNKALYDFIVKNGKEVKNGYFVISGVLGELDIITFNELSSQFTFGDGTHITKEAIQNMIAKNRYFDWVNVISKRTANAIAYHIESKTVEPIKTNTGIQVINTPGIDHGKGDFIVCYLNQFNQPDINTLRIVNGIEFKEKFDNRGWQSVLGEREVQIEIPKSIVSELAMRNKVNKVNDFRGAQLSQVIEQILAWCKKTINQEIKFDYKKTDKGFNVIVSAIEDYRKRNNCVNVASIIEIGDKDLIFKQYNLKKDNSKSFAMEFKIPIDETTAEKLVEDRYVYFGLLGYVRGDVAANFKAQSNFTKDEYDGVERYTIASGSINRICRGLGRDYEEAVGEARLDAIRTIKSVDKAMTKSVMVAETTLFRGLPLKDVYEFGKCNESTLYSARMVNDAYSSTSLSLQSTVMFALPPDLKSEENKDKSKDGVIQILDKSSEINSIYVHNVAGWKEQFEILVDRCYDIQHVAHMLDLKTADGTIHVIRSKLVRHQPFGNIPTPKLREKGYLTYDNFGRVDLSKEEAEDKMHKAFNILRQKGITNAQYISKKVLPGFLDGEASTYIVIEAGDIDGKNGEKIATDLVYSMHKNIEEKDEITYFEIHGDKKELRNFWSDKNRNEGKTDYNYRWSTYNDEALKGENIDLGSIRILNCKYELTAEQVAAIIYSNFIYRKNVVAFPLLDIARYFAQVFQQVIVQEGYVVKQVFRVERIGKEDDPQDGYVPVKFRIDGDNDDDLLLQITFKRTDDANLKITYRGQAASKKVNESKECVYNKFNTDVAGTLAEEIIYTFASKLDLSCTAKMDRFLENYAVRNRFRFAMNGRQARKDGNGHTQNYLMLRKPEKYIILGAKQLGGEYKLLIACGNNKEIREMIVFTHQSSSKEISKMFNGALQKIRDKMSFNELLNMNIEDSNKKNDSEQIA